MFDYELKRSLDEHKIITIMYQKEQQITERKIKVIKIYEDKIEAYCYLRGKIRYFKKNNILAATYLQ